MPEDTHQQRQEQQGIYVPPAKSQQRTDLPVNTSVSKPMGGSMAFSMGQESGPQGIGAAGSGDSGTYAGAYF